MKVTYRQQFLLPGGEPPLSRRGLTLGAVPIPTGVVREGLIAAPRTLVTMSTQGSGATTHKSEKHLLVYPANPMAVVLDEATTLCTNDVGHLQGRPAHLF